MKTELITSLLLGSSLFVAPSIQAETETLDPVQVWTKNCKKCHGDDGVPSKIGTKFGARDYTDPKVQKSFTDEEIVKVTKEGVFDENGKKKMPPYNKKLSDAEIEAMVPIIRAFAESK